MPWRRAALPIGSAAIAAFSAFSGASPAPPSSASASPRRSPDGNRVRAMTPRLTRRSLVIAAAASAAATPAFAAECHIGPPAHEKGPRVFLDYDQIELDAAYDQTAYAPLEGQILQRLASLSAAARERLGAPRRESYGPSEIEKLDLYRTS